MGGTDVTATYYVTENIFNTWRELFGCCKENKMKFGFHQSLEKIIQNITDVNRIVIELYLPIIVD